MDVTGNVGQFVDLVGEANFYREYEVAVQAYNSEGFGPMSPISVIRSAMGCEYSFFEPTVALLTFNSFLFDGKL